MLRAAFVSASTAQPLKLAPCPTCWRALTVCIELRCDGNWRLRFIFLCSTQRLLLFQVSQVMAAPALRVFGVYCVRMWLISHPPAASGCVCMSCCVYFSERRITGGGINYFVTHTTRIQWHTSPSFGTPSWVRLYPHVAL